MNPESMEIRVSIDELKEVIALADALATLEKTEAFKAVILDGFLKDNALKMASQVSSPSEHIAKGALNSLIGKGALESYLRYVHMQGEQAKVDLANHEQALLNSSMLEE